MAVLEGIEKNVDIKTVEGEIPIKSRYTLGKAGERFFRALKDKGQILASFCPKCNLWILPPSIFCERCFSRMEEWKDVGLSAIVGSYTFAYIGLDGNKLEEPEIFALLLWDKVEGGLIHRLGKVSPEEVEIGMRVKAVLLPKKERKGLITDIKYFEKEK